MSDGNFQGCSKLRKSACLTHGDKCKWCAGSGYCTKISTECSQTTKAEKIAAKKTGTIIPSSSNGTNGKKQKPAKKPKDVGPKPASQVMPRPPVMPLQKLTDKIQNKPPTNEPQRPPKKPPQHYNGVNTNANNDDVDQDLLNGVDFQGDLPSIFYNCLQHICGKISLSKDQLFAALYDFLLVEILKEDIEKCPKYLKFLDAIRNSGHQLSRGLPYSLSAKMLLSVIAYILTHERVVPHIERLFVTLYGLMIPPKYRQDLHDQIVRVINFTVYNNGTEKTRTYPIFVKILRKHALGFGSSGGKEKLLSLKDTTLVIVYQLISAITNIRQSGYTPSMH